MKICHKKLFEFHENNIQKYNLRRNDYLVEWDGL